jgi:hypothetical protein
MKATLRDGAKIALSVLGRRNKKEEARKKLTVDISRKTQS